MRGEDHEDQDQPTVELLLPQMPAIEKTSIVVALNPRPETGLSACETDGSELSDPSDDRFHFFSSPVC